MAVAFQDIADNNFPKENLSFTEFTGTRQALVNWADRRTYMGEVLGTLWPSVYHSVNAYAVATSCEPPPGAKTTDLGGGYTGFEKSIVTVRYSTKPVRINDTVLGFEELMGAQEEHHIDKAGLYWASDGTDALEDIAPPSFYSPMLSYLRGYAGVDEIPSDVALCPGCVNAVPVACFSLGLVFEAETLKFADCRTKRTVKTTGADAWTLTYWFSYKPNYNPNWVAQGWNYFWRPKEGIFKPIYLADGTRYKPNRPGNFNLLFV